MVMSFALCAFPSHHHNYSSRSRETRHQHHSLVIVAYYKATIRVVARVGYVAWSSYGVGRAGEKSSQLGKSSHWSRPVRGTLIHTIHHNTNSNTYSN